MLCHRMWIRFVLFGFFVLDCLLSAKNRSHVHFMQTQLLTVPFPRTDLSLAVCRFLIRRSIFGELCLFGHRWEAGYILGLMTRTCEQRFIFWERSRNRD